MKKLVEAKKRLVPAAIFVVVIVAAYILIGHVNGGESNAKELAAFEVQSVLALNETNVSAQASGEIKEVLVQEGEYVTRGQVMAVIDNSTLMIKKAQAEASIQTIQGQIHGAAANQSGAAAKVTQVREGAKPQEVEQVKIQYEQAESNFQRIEMLYLEGGVSQVEYESAMASRDVKKAQYEIIVNGAKASELQAAQSGLDAAYASAESLQGQLKSAQCVLDDINLQLSRAVIISPADGIVMQLTLKEGEMVSSGAKSAVIVDDSIPYIECSVKETDISQVKIGQSVAVRFGADQEKSYPGEVVLVSKNADFAMKRATNENGSFDVRSYKVKVKLDIQTDIPLYAGMTAFVAFPQN